MAEFTEGARVFVIDRWLKNGVEQAKFRKMSWGRHEIETGRSMRLVVIGQIFATKKQAAAALQEVAEAAIRKNLKAALKLAAALEREGILVPAWLRAVRGANTGPGLRA